MRRFTGSRTTALLFCVWLGTTLAWGQSTAEIRGKVTDGSHKPVVSAFILVTGQDASLMRAATTDDAGEFEFPSLPIDTYQLQVKADDFLAFEASGIRASIGQVINLNVVLSRNGGSASSLRTGNASMIEAGNAQLGVVMDHLDVTELPLKSRDTFDLLQLQPGVQGKSGVSRKKMESVPGGRQRNVHPDGQD